MTPIPHWLLVKLWLLATNYPPNWLTGFAKNVACRKLGIC